MKKLLLTLLFFSSLAFGQSDWLSPAGMTQVMNGQDDSVTPGSAHEGESHAGVPARGFDDCASGLQVAIPLGRLDHAQRDAVLDAGEGVS